MAEFSIQCKFKAGHDVRLLAGELRDALISARALSANFDIGFASVSQTGAAAGGGDSTLLCQFHQGLLYKVFPAGEALIGNVADYL